MWSYIQTAIRRALSSLACLVAIALVVVGGTTARVARAQACFSSDHKLSIGATGLSGACNQSDDALLSQTGAQVQWPWADANDGDVVTFTIMGCTGVVTACSVSPSSSIDFSGTVTVTFNTTATGGQGTIRLRMRDTVFHEFVDATALINTPFTYSTAFTNATDQSLPRCTQSCFAAHVTLSTP